MCGSLGVGERVVTALHGGSMRVYSTDDLVGVEVGGAVKNIMAIATGIVDGLGLGLNARAALFTRGRVEISWLGIALGGRPETFMGLTGMGDLILTCTGELRATGGWVWAWRQASRSMSSWPNWAMLPRACAARRRCVNWRSNAA